MSEFKGTRCDGCGKCVHDYYAEVGWLHFDSVHSNINLTRAAGRGEKNAAKTDFLQGVSDFCSVDCLRDRLDREATKRGPVK